MKRRKSKKVPIFNSDGTVKETELKIMNFRPIGNSNKNGDTEDLNKQWEEVCIERPIQCSKIHKQIGKKNRFE